MKNIFLFVKIISMDLEDKLVLKSSTLLFAEDEKIVQESMGELLSLYVKEIFFANDAKEAYTLYKEKSPDILITDLRMPKVDGIDLIKKIREKDKSLPIVVMSAETQKSDLLKLVKLSLIEYIVKPVKKAKLDSALESVAKYLKEHSKGLIFFDDKNFYDYKNKIFISNNISIHLTPKEIELFELLLAHKGELVKKQTIEDRLYIYHEASPSALKNIVFKLRKKLPIDIIKTCGRLGYKIEI